MILVASFDLELHKMNIKTTFPNKNSNEMVYINQREGFYNNTNSHLFCKLKKIYIWTKT
jgi:hypothetical protein